MTIYRVIAILFIALILWLIMRNINERYTVFITIAFSVLILIYITGELSSIFSFIKKIADNSGLNNKYFKTIIKGLSICYLCEFIAGFCKDCGQNGWADKVELACKCTLLVLAMPLFEDLLKMVIRLME